MPTADSNIKTFTTLVRQLILKTKELKRENVELYAMVDERDRQIAELKKQVEEQKKKYHALISTRELVLADEDIEMTRKRINKLIRTVNQCITMLSEQNDKDA